MERALTKVSSLKVGLGSSWISKKAKEEFSNISEDFSVSILLPFLGFLALLFFFLILFNVAWFLALLPFGVCEIWNRKLCILMFLHFRVMDLFPWCKGQDIAWFRIKNCCFACLCKMGICFSFWLYLKKFSGVWACVISV